MSKNTCNDPKLSVNFFKSFNSRGSTDEEPILQFKSYSLVEKSVAEPRYTATFYDGTDSYPSAILIENAARAIYNGSIQKNSIIKLTQYFPIPLPSSKRPAILVRNMVLLQPASMVSQSSISSVSPASVSQAEPISTSSSTQEHEISNKGRRTSPRKRPVGVSESPRRTSPRKRPDGASESSQRTSPRKHPDGASESSQRTSPRKRPDGASESHRRTSPRKRSVVVSECPRRTSPRRSPMIISECPTQSRSPVKSTRLQGGTVAGKESALTTVTSDSSISSTAPEAAACSSDHTYARPADNFDFDLIDADVLSYVHVSPPLPPPPPTQTAFLSAPSSPVACVGGAGTSSSSAGASPVLLSHSSSSARVTLEARLDHLQSIASPGTGGLASSTRATTAPLSSPGHGPGPIPLSAPAPSDAPLIESPRAPPPATTPLAVNSSSPPSSMAAPNTDAVLVSVTNAHPVHCTPRAVAPASLVARSSAGASRDLQSPGLASPATLERRRIYIGSITNLFAGDWWRLRARVVFKSNLKADCNSSSRSFDNFVLNITLQDSSGRIHAAAFTKPNAMQLFRTLRFNHIYYLSNLIIKRIDKAKLAAPRSVHQACESASGTAAEASGSAGAEAGQAAAARQHIVDHPNGCELVLNQFSSVHEVKASELLLAEDAATCVQFAFTPLAELRNLPDRALIDVIGVVVQTNALQSVLRKSECQTRELRIIDDSGHSYPVTLWHSDAVFYNPEIHKSLLIVKGAVMKEYEGSRSINVFWQSSMDVVRFEELDKLVAPPANSDYTPMFSSRSLTAAGPEALAHYPADAFRLRDWFRNGGMFERPPLDAEVFGAEASADPTSAWVNCINPPPNPPRLQLPASHFAGCQAQRWERSVHSLQRMQPPEPPAFELPNALQQVYEAGQRTLSRRSASVDLLPPPRPRQVTAPQPTRLIFPPFPSSSSSTAAKHPNQTLPSAQAPGQPVTVSLVSSVNIAASASVPTTTLNQPSVIPDGAASDASTSLTPSTLFENPLLHAALVVPCQSTAGSSGGPLSGLRLPAPQVTSSAAADERSRSSSLSQCSLMDIA